jgi:hypothetical protein
MRDVIRLFRQVAPLVVATTGIVSCENNRTSTRNQSAPHPSTILADPIQQQYALDARPSARHPQLFSLRLEHTETSDGEIQNVQPRFDAIARGLNNCVKHWTASKLAGPIDITLAVNRAGRVTRVEPEQLPRALSDWLAWECIRLRLGVVEFNPQKSDRLRIRARLSGVVP